MLTCPVNQDVDEVTRLRSELESARSEVTRLSGELQQAFEELKLVRELTAVLHSSRCADTVAQVSVRSVKEVAEAGGAGLFLQEPERPWQLVHMETSQEAVCDFFNSTESPTWANHVCTEGKPVIVNDANLAARGLAMPTGVYHLIGVPLKARIGQAALIACNRLSGEGFTPRELNLVMAASGQCSAALENAIAYGRLDETFSGLLSSLTTAIDGHCTWMAGHSHRVTHYALRLGHQLGLEERQLKRLRIAGLLHDIGRICVAQSILEKPGKLMDLEFAIIKQHPVVGSQMLSGIHSFHGDILDGVRYHHERVDGTGYPEGKCNNEIPLFGRLLAVADAFAAMTCDRPYRPALSRNQAMDELVRGQDGQWDRELVCAFGDGMRNGHTPSVAHLLLPNPARRRQASFLPPPAALAR